MEVVNKFMNEINLFGVVVTFIGLIFAILALKYSRKVAILQGTYKKPNIKMFCINYDLFNVDKIYFSIPFQNKEELIMVPFEFGLINNGDKSAIDVQVQFTSFKGLLLDQEYLHLEKKQGHYFHKMDVSVSDIGNKRSMAFYYQKIEPDQIINTQFNYLIFHPDYDLTVPVTFKDKTQTDITVIVTLNFVLDFFFTSDDSKSEIKRQKIVSIDTSITEFKDLLIDYSNNLFIKYFQIIKTQINIYYFRHTYDTFFLFNVERSKLVAHDSVPNLFLVDGGFNDFQKYIGLEKNGKIITYNKI